jgi:hypothetical protein
MLRRTLRLGLKLGAVAGLVAVAVRILGSKREREETPGLLATEPWPPLRPVPASDDAAEPPATALRPDPDAPMAPAWVEPEADGRCPATHPVKAKLASKIFHLPGMMNYERTRPDRCYRDAAAAEADGLRAAKR